MTKIADKACFQHDMAYGDFKDLPRRTASDKVLCNKAFNIDLNSKYDGYQRGVLSMVYTFFDKKSSVDTTLGGAIENQKDVEPSSFGLNRRRITQANY